jgi:hypothetical protein
MLSSLASLLKRSHDRSDALSLSWPFLSLLSLPPLSSAGPEESPYEGGKFYVSDRTHMKDHPSRVQTPPPTPHLSFTRRRRRRRRSLLLQPSRVCDIDTYPAALYTHRIPSPYSSSPLLPLAYPVHTSRLLACCSKTDSPSLPPSLPPSLTAHSLPSLRTPQVDIQLTDSYPFEPPKMRFITKVGLYKL